MDTLLDAFLTAIIAGALCAIAISTTRIADALTTQPPSQPKATACKLT